MAPKKKQQQRRKQNNSKSQPPPQPPASGPKLQISAENEQRLRRLLLNNATANSVRSASTQNDDESQSLSKAQKAKKLKSIYEKLSCEGFSDDQIERALSVLKDYATFEAALDWLCLNLSPKELPVKFSDGSTRHTNEGGSIGVVHVSTSRGDHTSSMEDNSILVSETISEISVRVKGSRETESLDSLEPSQADWIRQYMEKEEQADSGDWEDMFSDDDTEKVKEPRSSDTIISEYQAARLEAIAAKENRDRKSQERASLSIRRLKQEMSSLGISDELLSCDYVNDQKTVARSRNMGSCEGPSEHSETVTLCLNETSVSDSIVSWVEKDKESSTNLGTPVRKETSVEEETGDVELGGFFMEEGPSDEPLLEEVLKKQKKEKARDLSRKNLEQLEGIWKKGDPPRLPKALLHQLCQKSGWDPPKYDKMGRRAKGFSYSLSILRKSSGRGKSRKAGGLITLHLPDKDEAFESAEEAQNRVAAFALLRLFPDLPVYTLITEPYASLVDQWEEGESYGKVEESQDARRVGFVDSLLNSVDTEYSTTVDTNASPNEGLFDMPQQQERHSASKSSQRKEHLIEKESCLLRQELENKRNMPRYKGMLGSRTALPIAKSKGKILELLEDNNVIVVCGETGSGKTTQVPQYILDDMIEAGNGGRCNVICTQPRRIAAISVAERVADERCEPYPGSIGSLIGYQVRLDSARTDKTKLLFCTTGILLRKFAGDKDLNGITHVIVDEVHERSLLGDFLLIILKNLLEKKAADGKPMVKVILMSATVDSNLFSTFFGACPVVTAEGRTHPVSTYFLEEVYEKVNYKLASDSPAYLSFETSGLEVSRAHVNDRRGKKNLFLASQGDETLLADEYINPNYNPSAYQSYSDQTRKNLRKLNEDVIDYDLLEDLVCHIDETRGEGAILVFLPGVSEIYRLLDRLAASYRFGGESANWLLALHSSIVPADQKKIFLQPPQNIRKVIIATNIAETSITIDDVVYVIDSGKHKENRYNPQKKLSSMVEDWISQANAKQRRGRAGRVKPGICFCLYTQYRFDKLMRRFQAPEMLRMPLVELCLQIKLLSLGNIKALLLKALEPPKEEAINSAVSMLYEVGAIAGNEELTPLGHHLAKLPVDLLVGKMMLYGAIFGCLSPILSISAFLSYKSPFVYPKNERDIVQRSKWALLTDELDKSRELPEGDRQSDHIVMMVAYRKWEKILREEGAKAAQKFCSSYSLGSSVMYMIRDMRAQFGLLLADMGLVTLPKDYQGAKKQNLDIWLSDASQPFNKYAHHPAVLKAILCAGLYPNVAAAMEGIYVPGLGNLRQSLSTGKGYNAWYDGKREVHIHPSSVNSNLTTYSHPFLVFLEKVETNKIFLRDTTIISPYSLLLFGGSINVQHQIGVVTIDGWLKVNAAAQTAVLFKELRSTLDSVLKDLINNPQKAAVDDEIMRSIIHLLLEEDKARV